MFSSLCNVNKKCVFGSIIVVGIGLGAWYYCSNNSVDDNDNSPVVDDVDVEDVDNE